METYQWSYCPVYNLSIISNIPMSVQHLLDKETYSVRLRPLFAIGVHDIPLLERMARDNASTSLDQGYPLDEVLKEKEKGWIACSTDDVLAMKSRLYDVLVTMPPAYAKQARQKIWPKVESPRATAVKATQRDLRRYKTLQRAFRRHKARGGYRPSGVDNGNGTEIENDNDPDHDHNDDNDNEHLSLIPPTPEEAFDETLSTSDESLIEPLSWPALAYSSFMWWASAGEKGADLDDEVEQDSSLMDGLWGSTESPSEQSRSSPKPRADLKSENARDVMPEMAVIAYFHRLTAAMFSTLADIVDCSDADHETDGEEDMLTVSTDDMTRMGLDIWSDSDRKFVEDLMEMYFGRKADVQGAKVECCGVRIC